MKCKNCTTEVSEIKNEDGNVISLRCLKCHPMPNGNVIEKAKKENVRVDEPWTDARVWKAVEPKVRELFADLIEDYVITQNKTETEGLTEGFIHDLIAKKTWREEAKELDIPVYDKENNRPRKKVDVLADIAAKLEAPE